ncbi:UPF0481 protein At3g47200-like [Aegilops tauschii subsp. strangulata]|uniref:Uncharacterized protein n=2 Tax=Aegilops tauschii TaxID=37682 RepID=A0A452XK47_AEGTS|nr:uncharacterized protein LOC109780916 [Aegilops tauschii subsp. strangulata]
MSMEPSWVVTCDSGCSMEEAAAWSDDRISFQTSLTSHSDSVQLQVVEYASPALTPAPTTHDTCSDQDQVFKEAVEEVHANYLEIMQKKMHKFPPSLADVDGRYRVPVSVAIGPYHNGRPGMAEAEKMKNVAANQCVRDSTGSLQEMYNAVSFVSPDARNLCYQDESAKFRDDAFLPMMFLDACFLVQFMLWYQVEDGVIDLALDSYFYANFERIYTDIMMLENQIPWVVVQAILDFMPPGPSWPLKKFIIAMRNCLKNQKDDDDDDESIDVVTDNEPPHLLGLVWYYIVGENKKGEIPPGFRPMSLSMSVAELADVGITLAPMAKTEGGLVDMGLERKLPLSGVISVRPLCLTDANATWLVNMAAFELCRDYCFDDISDGNSAVCSYLQLFVMLLDKKEHVHDLREKGVIQGGGLTSEETLVFFIYIGKNMRVGRNYLKIMIEVEDFKQKMTCYLKLWLSIKKNRTRIMTVISAIGVVIGILSSLPALKPR